jgi:hypothetical protein
MGIRSKQLAKEKAFKAIVWTLLISGVWASAWTNHINTQEVQQMNSHLVALTNSNGLSE